MPVIFFGVGLPDDRIHAPNERVVIPMLLKRRRSAGVPVERARGTRSLCRMSETPLVRKPLVVAGRRLARMLDIVADPDRCYRAIQSRDSRFDGWFVTAVRSTHIYCRPSCPARLPRREGVRFYASAAAAQQAGYRACKRCRPDASPGSPEWDVRADLVARAMRLIGDGVVDRDGRRRAGGAAGLHHRATSPGCSPPSSAPGRWRSPARSAPKRRGCCSRRPMSPSPSVAFAAGFASLRQFNDTVREVFATPGARLRGSTRERAETSEAAEPGTVRLRLTLPAACDVAATLRSSAAGGSPASKLRSDGRQHVRGSLDLPHGAGASRCPGPAEPGYVRADLALDRPA